MCVCNVRNYVTSTLQDAMLLETVPDVTDCMPFTNSTYFYSNIYSTRWNITQFILSGNYSTCFGWYHHSSSGAQTIVSTASGICHIVIAICRYRGRCETGLSVLWLAYVTHSTYTRWSMHSTLNPELCGFCLSLYVCVHTYMCTHIRADIYIYIYTYISTQCHYKSVLTNYVSHLSWP
jgi:hypothetical protein